VHLPIFNEPEFNPAAVPQKGKYLWVLPISVLVGSIIAAVILGILLEESAETTTLTLILGITVAGLLAMRASRLWDNAKKQEQLL